MVLWKCWIQYVSKSGKLGSGYRTRKDQFFIPIPKKGNTKECSNYHTTALISMLTILCSKSFKLGFSNMWTKNFQIYSWVKKMQVNQRPNCQHSLDHRESRGIPANHLLLLYWLCQSLWTCRWQQTVENSSRDGNTRSLYLYPEKCVCRSRSTS